VLVGGVLDHLTERAAGGIEIVPQSGDLVGEVPVGLPGLGEFLAQCGYPLDQRRASEVGELLPEGALQVSADPRPRRGAAVRTAGFTARAWSTKGCRAFRSVVAFLADRSIS
jgi:hypothetical protein